jgi:hypothetical protein
MAPEAVRASFTSRVNGLKLVLRGQFAQGWREAESARRNSSYLRTNKALLRCSRRTRLREVVPQTTRLACAWGPIRARPASWCHVGRECGSCLFYVDE